MVEYTQIQGTALVSSRIALGTWAIGGWMWGGTDEKGSIRTIHAALAKGNTVAGKASSSPAKWELTGRMAESNAIPRVKTF